MNTCEESAFHSKMSMYVRIQLQTRKQNKQKCLIVSSKNYQNKLNLVNSSIIHSLILQTLVQYIYNIFNKTKCRCVYTMLLFVFGGRVYTYMYNIIEHVIFILKNSHVRQWTGPGQILITSLIDYCTCMWPEDVARRSQEELRSQHFYLTKTEK